MRVCVVGGGAALAEPLLVHWDCLNREVVAVCPHTPPKTKFDGLTLFKSSDGVGGEYDLLVTLAGLTADRKLMEMTPGEWEGVIGRTLSSVFHALRNVKVKDGGNVVVVGSVLGSTGGYGCANYAAAKAGLVGLVRSAALEWASRKVCVNLLELGFTDVGMGARLPEKVKARALTTIPLGRFGTVEDFVHAVEFLSTTRYMTGGVLTLAGGLR